MRGIVLVVTTVLMFGHCGLPGLLSGDPVSVFLWSSSLLVILFAVALCLADTRLGNPGDAPAGAAGNVRGPERLTF